MIKKKKVYRDYLEFLDEELQDPEVALGYLNETLKDKDHNVFLTALRDVLRAQNKDISELARDTKISRQNIYRMLSKKGNPRWENLNVLFDKLGFEIQLSLKK